MRAEIGRGGDYVKWTLSFPEDFVAEVKRSAKENHRSFSEEIVSVYRSHVYRTLPKEPPNPEIFDSRGLLPNITEDYRTLPNDTEDYRKNPRSSPPSPLTLRDQLVVVDAKPTGGSWQNPDSACRKRRKAQIVLLSKAWRELFPRAFQLTERSAKDFLSKTGDNGLAVYDAFLVAAERGVDGMGVVNYISKVLVNAQLSTQRIESEYLGEDWQSDSRRGHVQLEADGRLD